MLLLFFPYNYDLVDTIIAVIVVDDVVTRVVAATIVVLL